MISLISPHKFPLYRFRIDVISLTTDGALQTFHFVLLRVTGNFCCNRLFNSDALCYNPA